CSAGPWPCPPRPSLRTLPWSTPVASSYPFGGPASRRPRWCHRSPLVCSHLVVEEATSGGERTGQPDRLVIHHREVVLGHGFLARERRRAEEPHQRVGLVGGAHPLHLAQLLRVAPEALGLLGAAAAAAPSLAHAAVSW